jgi:hypothetical protein
MSSPPHSPWFNHPNNIRWRIQAVKFIIMQFSPRSIFLPSRSKYPQHSVLKNPQSMLLRQSERPSFAPQHDIQRLLLQLGTSGQTVRSPRRVLPAGSQHLYTLTAPDILKLTVQ